MLFYVVSYVLLCLCSMPCSEFSMVFCVFLCCSVTFYVFLCCFMVSDEFGRVWMGLGGFGSLRGLGKVWDP